MAAVTREAIVAEALRWVDTPFKHQGRLHGVGVDCAGLVEMVPKALGLYADVTVGAYGRQPDPAAMRAELARHLDPIRFAELLPGDVLYFRVELDPQHLGIVISTDRLSMVHAFGRDGVDRVVVTTIDYFWKSRIAGCWRYRGLC